MATDKKISQLNSITGAEVDVNNDLLVIVDIDAGANGTKKITPSEFSIAIGNTGPQGPQGPQGPSGANGGTDIILDTTPQLGGNLDVNGFTITALSNANVVVSTTGTGTFAIIGNVNQTSGILTADRSTLTLATLTYGATTNLDMSALTGTYQTVSLTGDVTFTTSNRAAGRSVVLRIICDGTNRNFTFPAGWKFLGASAPTSIAASKTAILSITLFGINDTDAICAYSVEP